MASRPSESQYIWGWKGKSQDWWSVLSVGGFENWGAEKPWPRLGEHMHLSLVSLGPPQWSYLRTHPKSPSKEGYGQHGTLAHHHRWAQPRGCLALRHAHLCQLQNPGLPMATRGTWSPRVHVLSAQNMWFLSQGGSCRWEMGSRGWQGEHCWWVCPCRGPGAGPPVP